MIGPFRDVCFKIEGICINSANMSYDIQRPLGRLCRLYSCVSRFRENPEGYVCLHSPCSVVSCATLPWLGFRESGMHRDVEGKEVGLE